MAHDDRRYAIVSGARDEREVSAYLPDNYELVRELADGTFLISGEDVGGWTLDGYLTPRLASGSLGCTEIDPGAGQAAALNRLPDPPPSNTTSDGVDLTWAFLSDPLEDDEAGHDEPEYTAPTADELQLAADIIHRVRMTWDMPERDTFEEEHQRDWLVKTGLNAGWHALIALRWEARHRDA